jgi:hypothetical protein
MGVKLLDPAARYGPVPPLGIFYRVARGKLAVIGVVNARRLRWLPGRRPGC